METVGLNWESLMQASIANESLGLRLDRSIMEEIPEALDIQGLGEGLKVTSSAPVELDKSFASWLLRLPDLSYDRKVETRHVAKLKAAMERGTFQPSLVQVITCKLDGQEWRINGAHCSYARLEVDDKYRCPIRHIRYVAKTENDMRRLYASVDRGKPRTKSNVVSSYLFDTPEWSGFGKHVIGVIAEGMGIWLWPSSHERSMRDGDDRACLLLTDYLKLGKKVAEFIQGNQSALKSKFIRRAPVIGAMLATFDKNVEQATTFWSSVVSGIGFEDESDPRNVLRTILMQAALRHGRPTGKRQSGYGSRSMSQEEMYRVCVLAWNAYRTNGKLRQTKPNLNVNRPEVV